MPPTDAATAPERRGRLSPGRRLPAGLPTAALVLVTGVALASADGGYFATSWGWAATALFWAIGFWAVLGGRTDLGRLDLAFLGLLTLLAAWTALSITWSVAPVLSVREVERVLVLVSGVAAFLLLTGRRTLPLVAPALLATIGLVSAYALATRLFPDRLGSYDPFAVYRLSSPIGYWNGLGIFAVMGLLLAAGVVTRAGRAWHRGAAAAAIVVMAPALYFTYSRGAWIALGAGLAATIVVSPERLRTVVAVVVAGAPAAVAVVLASRSYGLTHEQVPLAQAVDDGRRIAVALVALAFVAAAGAVALHVAQARLRVPRRARLAGGAALWAGVAAAAIVLVVRFGSPVSMPERAWDAFDAPPPASSTDLNRRLLSFSGNGRVELWTAAHDEYGERPVLGAGAGTFERLWQAREDASQRVRDAHGLYVETLAELGPVGLMLLVAALLVPLGAAIVARATPLVPAAAGAYAAFLLHAGIDWDWELAGVTLVALFVGCSLVVSARRRDVRLMPAAGRTAIAVVVGLAGLASLLAALGHSALAEARAAIERRDVDVALADARRAEQLMPWSPDPWLARGEAELVAARPEAAARSFRRAVELDEGDWRAWLALAIATDGRARTAALERARALYPRSTEIARTAARLRAIERQARQSQDAE